MMVVFVLVLAVTFLGTETSSTFERVDSEGPPISMTPNGEGGGTITDANGNGNEVEFGIGDEADESAVDLEDGWARFTQPDDFCAVDLPDRPTSMNVGSDMLEGSGMSIDTWVATETMTSAVTVQWTWTTDDDRLAELSDDPENLLEGFVAGTESSMDSSFDTVTPIEVGGFPAVEVEGDMQMARIRGVFAVTDTGILSISVTGKGEFLDATYPRVLASLEFP